MYKWLSVLWTSCFVIGCLVGAEKEDKFKGFKDSPRPRRETCSEGQYYDRVTGNCDECAPHCDRPDHSPPTPCQRFCGERADNSSRTRGEETPRPPCETGTYYDDVTGHCDPCGPHCDQFPVNDPPLQCRNYCRDSEKSQGDQPVLPAWAIVVIVVSILIVVAAIGAFIVYRHKQQARQNIQLVIPENEQIKRPVVEDTIPNELSEMVPNPSNV